MRKLALASSLVALAGFLAAGTAEADLGDVQQLSGTDGCVSEDGTGGACANGVALNGATSVFASPDDKNVYVASSASHAIAVFDRNTTTGALTQKTGTDGCVRLGGGACGTAVAVSNPVGPQSVTVSPDNKSVYLAAKGDSAVAIFDRNPATGVITQKAAPNGCISMTGSGGNCVVGRGLTEAFGVVVSPDGETVYVTSVSDTDGGIAIFDRDTTTGALTQKPGAGGCITQSGAGGCEDGRGLRQSETIAIPQSGENLYVAAFASNAVAIFDRAETGSLTQKPGAAGCMAQFGGEGCAAGRGLFSVNGIALSPDDRNVYGAALSSDAIAIFDRNPSDGTLTQPPGQAGCVSDTGSDGCADGVALDGPEDITVAKDGRTVHSVSKFSGALNIFVRDTRSGGLTQKPGTAGCVSGTGNGGACATGKAMGELNSLADSADEKNVYLAAHASDAVDVFGRDLVDVAPTGVDDASTVAQDAPATAIDVQANDTDPDSGVNTITSVTQPANGTVRITNDAYDLEYEPDPDTCNDGAPTDDFTYTLNGGSTATVRVTVTCSLQPDAQVKLATDAEYAGRDIYNTTGEGQSVEASRKRGKTMLFDFLVENDSPTTATFTVRGNGDNRAYRARYFDGDTDITKEVVAGSYSTGALVSGAAKEIRAVVRLLTANNNRNTKEVRVLASGVRGSQDMAVGRVRPTGSSGRQ